MANHIHFFAFYGITFTSFKLTIEQTSFIFMSVTAAHFSLILPPYYQYLTSVDKENFLEFRMIKLSSFGPFNIYLLFIIKVEPSYLSYYCSLQARSWTFAIGFTLSVGGVTAKLWMAYSVLKDRFVRSRVMYFIELVP